MYKIPSMKFSGPYRTTSVGEKHLRGTSYEDTLVPSQHFRMLSALPTEKSTNCGKVLKSNTCPN